MNPSYKFDPKKCKDAAVQWIRDWFSCNGPECKAIIGISGGKDSSVVAALCVEALGRERVVGVIMPNITQPDIDDAWELIHHLSISGYVIPITNAVQDTLNAMKMVGVTPSNQAMVNLPARIRMSTLYAVSQSMNGRVANTCNLSENRIGYFTRYGDGAGDFSPLGMLTCTEVIAIGHELGLPAHLVDKVPSDGLCGKSDEDNFGFTYEQLDHSIRLTEDVDERVMDRIRALEHKNAFKLMPEPTYQAHHDIFCRRIYTWED